MWAPLRGLWGDKHPAKTAPAAAAAAALPDEPGLPVADAVLDGRFSAFLLSLEQLRPDDPGPIEQAVLSRLEELIHARGPRELLPRLPVVLPKLMSLVRRDDVSARELAEHLSKDPALVSEVIRIANSPRYRASLEAYLAGMVVNAGLIPALRVLDQNYVGAKAPDTVAFHAGFLMLSLRMSASIAREWHFPEGVTQAVTALATLPPPQPPAPLAVVLRSADQFSKRHLLMSAQGQAPMVAGESVDPCLAELERVFGAGHGDH